ncbi:helix-hairpin-helix domain-containing protein [Bosea vestrisii]|uniref:ComEA family DNA-binding protein n=1 Tax=Bosea vestrisii TaxID=151416 RepID=UPI0024DFC406|nr:helix-hairpin-helix domain-containing protein [Bosea vestrisii]WID97696.1 helix-hairpin-helix domain-containing protein [Bosea vestrisii]
MTMSRFAISLAALALAAGPAFAQTATQPTTPAKPAAPVTTPAAPAAKPAAPAATQAQAKKVNINTASASELEQLKGIGEARSKKIVEERAKAKFKNFDDLVKRSVLPSNVEADIKDHVTF